ncbi:MAG: alcohol dehydrogenase [Planctomyces sp.]|nr:alcohol dehydrogenase [Planctomyces sp.]
MTTFGQGKAVLFQGNGQPLDACDAPLPDLKPGEALVAISATTLCGSDLHTFHGRRETATPAVLGHEIIGRIVALSLVDPPRPYDGTPLHVGERVTWSVCVNCGDCFFCNRDLPQKCEHLLKYGHQSFALEPWCGGLASHLILRRNSAIFRIPDHLPDEVACPANCATATVAGALRHAGNIDGATVVITGAGMLGLTAAAMAKEAGAKVILVDREQTRLEEGAAFGAAAVIQVQPEGESLREQVLERTEGRGADVVFEMTGAPAVARRGIDLLRTGGQLILVGSVFPTEPIDLYPEQVVRRMLEIKGVHNYAPQDLGAALTFLAEHGNAYPFASLVGAEFPLSDCEAAFAYAATGKTFRVRITMDS